jgi:hypothetical protein
MQARIVISIVPEICLIYKAYCKVGGALGIYPIYHRNADSETVALSQILIDPTNNDCSESLAGKRTTGCRLIFRQIEPETTACLDR